MYRGFYAFRTLWTLDLCSAVLPNVRDLLLSRYERLVFFFLVITATACFFLDNIVCAMPKSWRIFLPTKIISVEMPSIPHRFQVPHCHSDPLITSTIIHHHPLNPSLSTSIIHHYLPYPPFPPLLSIINLHHRAPFFEVIPVFCVVMFKPEPQL